MVALTVGDPVRHRNCGFVGHIVRLGMPGQFVCEFIDGHGSFERIVSREDLAPLGAKRRLAELPAMSGPGSHREVASLPPGGRR